MFELKTQKNHHAKYRLEYHLVLVTKYRKHASRKKCSFT